MDYQRKDGKKRSSLKAKEVNLNGLTMQDYLSANSQKKNLKWNEQVTNLEKEGQLPTADSNVEIVEGEMMEIVTILFYLG